MPRCARRERSPARRRRSAGEAWRCQAVRPAAQSRTSSRSTRPLCPCRRGDALQARPVWPPDDQRASRRDHASRRSRACGVQRLEHERTCARPLHRQDRVRGRCPMPALQPAQGRRTDRRGQSATLPESVSTSSTAATSARICSMRGSVAHADCKLMAKSRSDQLFCAAMHRREPDEAEFARAASNRRMRRLKLAEIYACVIV